MTTFDLIEAREILVGTPGSLEAQLSGLSHGWLSADEGELTWTPWQALAHLTHVRRTTGSGGSADPRPRAGRASRTGRPRGGVRPLRRLVDHRRPWTVRVAPGAQPRAAPRDVGGARPQPPRADRE